MTKRVVVTGMGAVTSLGHDWATFEHRLRTNPSGIRYMHEWDCYRDLNTRLGGVVPPFELPEHYTRKRIRSMGPVAIMATRATEMALEQAGLLGDPILGSGRVGISYGSCGGASTSIKDFGKMLANQDMSGMSATSYIRLMSHTAPVNIGVFFGIKGRVYTTTSACTSGSQGIGYAYEAIKFGKQVIMVAGGAEEICATQAAVFDTLYATSTRNDQPQTTPAPFDANRDGLVIGEGAGTLILEAYDHAVARGAKIIAEVVGYATNADGGHVTQPDSANMELAMRLALEDASLAPQDIAYVNAHGTATDRGDVAESHATARLFGSRMPISTLKGNLGHALGGCGAIEAWATIEMMNSGQFAPTHNLKNVDPNCGELDYIMGGFRAIDAPYVMSNNFAFGGINTSLIFKRV